MQFRRQQREQARCSWGPESWFFVQLGQPAREIIERAYGLLDCTPAERSAAQEYLSVALTLFAEKVNVDKSKVVHALLTGSITSLVIAIGRGSHGKHVNSASLAEAWQDSFREVTFAL